MSHENNFPDLQEAKKEMASLIAAYKPSRTIERIEIKVRPVDMIAWLSLQNDKVKIYGANQSDTVSIAGIGQAAGVTGKKLGSLPKVFKSLRSFLSPKYPYLQWYGGFCFDARHLDAAWKEFGAYRFVLPRFELAAQDGKMIFCCNLIGGERISGILKQLAQIVIPAKNDAETQIFGEDIKRVDQPDKQVWHKAVEKILSDKSVEKVVLARKTSLNFKQAPNPWAMLRQLKAVTPNSYHFAFQFNKTVFLGASPERLFRRFQRAVESEAIAGTMPKSVNPGQLQTSTKNRYEHALVVDAIDLAFQQMCKDFNRQKEPDVLTLPNGYHLITKFQGQLKDGIKDEDILELLHPTPALGGTPRKKALDLIRKLEGFSRGWYGAPLGYVGLDWAEFVVGIRSGLVSNKKLSVFAGAGIVNGSEPKSEWDEVENKISNFIKIIQ
jgi:menaquinone-specific isochorismate synthase